MSISDRYDALISADGCVPKPSVDRISSNVCPDAPFIVMPSAIEALSGDMKMFESARVRSSSRSRLNPNALLAPMTACSPLESARGSAVIRRAPPDGPVASLHAATTRDGSEQTAQTHGALGVECLRLTRRCVGSSQPCVEMMKYRL